MARATNLAPLSDEAWSARIAFYAQKQDIHQIQELIVEAKRQIPANESAIILTRSLDRAGLPNEVRNALYQSVGTMPAETISRESIQKLLQFGRIDEARRQLQTMATIGRAAAVADLGWIRFSGYLAWLVWLFIHLMYLVAFQNRVLVFIQWAWNYFTRNRSARLITNETERPLRVVEKKS